MASWFRSWHGAPTDPKWRVVARIANADLSQVISTVWTLLDHASQCADRGSIAGCDLDVIAESVGIPTETGERILLALETKNVIVDGRFAAWESRQPKREDDSTARVARHRETHGNAVKRNVTHGNNTETESETETETESEKSKRVPSQSCSPQAANETATKPKRAPKSPDGELLAAFDEFWKIYPRKEGKTPALRTWLREVRLEMVPDVIQAAIRYAELRYGEDGRFTKHAATWLNKGTWRDSLTDEKPKPPEGNGNGFKTRAQRDHENRRGFLDAFGITGATPADSGTARRGPELLGPGATDT